MHLFVLGSLSPSVRHSQVLPFCFFGTLLNYKALQRKFEETQQIFSLLVNIFPFTFLQQMPSSYIKELMLCSIADCLSIFCLFESCLLISLIDSLFFNFSIASLLWTVFLVFTYCPRSLDTIYKVTYHNKWTKTILRLAVVFLRDNEFGYYFVKCL